MGGLYKLFLKITPIIMLICFICFGITHTFQTEGAQPITYLGTEQVQYVVYTRDPNTDQIVSETRTQTIYTFDMQSYATNLNQNILKRATNNVIDGETYISVVKAYNNIWDNGYQFGDGVATLINSVLLVINTLIAPINILITPLRIIAGILLTGFSAVGINISRNTIIIRSLNGILDLASIPYLESTWNKQNNPEFEGTVWQFSTTFQNSVNFGTIDISFYSNGRTYSHMQMNTDTIKYGYDNQNGIVWETAAENGRFTNYNYKLIAITENNSINNQENQTLGTILHAYATKIDIYSTEWSFNGFMHITEDTGYLQVNFISNETEYSGLKFTSIDLGQLSYFDTSNYEVMVYYNEYWHYANEIRTIYIKNQNIPATRQLILYQLLTKYGAEI